MEAWQITLVVLGTLGGISLLAIVWMAAKREWSLNRLVLVVMAILIAIAVAVVPQWQIHSSNVRAVAAEASVLSEAFFGHYVNGSDLLGIQKPSDAYIAFRREGDQILVSLRIKGLFGEAWLELGSVDGVSE